MARIVMLTKGTLGDLVPMLAIGEALYAKGHRVTLLSHCDYQSMTEECNIEFVPLDSPGERTAFLSDLHLLNSITGTASFFREHCASRIEREYDLLSQEGSGENTILLTRHMASLADLVFSETLQCPLVRLFTTPLHARTCELAGELFGEMFTSVLTPLRVRLGLCQVLDIRRLLQTPVVNLGGWPRWFEHQPGRSAMEVTPVGFMTHDRHEVGDIPQDVEAVLRSNRRPVLIYASTGELLDGNFGSLAVDACTLLGVRAILVSAGCKSRPSCLPAEVIHCTRLPFASVMPRCSAIVHHGGIGTIARSIASGIPQLILPCGAERPYSASIVARLGIGLCLGRSMWNANSIALALSELIVSKKIRSRCILYSNVARGEHPAVRAAQLIEDIVCVAKGTRGCSVRDSRPLSRPIVQGRPGRRK